ncbi:MAG: hypothetical protein ABUK01_07280 [Leptospirales bacterium]
MDTQKSPSKASLPKFFKNYIDSLPLKESLPLYRQFRPSTKENSHKAGFCVDPLFEEPFTNKQNYIHKYKDRLLYLATDTCIVLCRYCTRKRKTFYRDSFNNENINANPEIAPAKAIKYLKTKPEIAEVIFSGGDPLTLKPITLYQQISQFCQIPQVKKIRIHTRMLSLAPDKININWLNILEKLPREFPLVSFTLVTHINHPSEITDACRRVFLAVKQAGWYLKNQSVLLKNVNDNEKTLQNLFCSLVQNGITPYYLHQLDRVSGTSHFEVKVATGVALLRNLQKQLPLCVIPLYVQDGKYGKKPIDLTFKPQANLVIQPERNFREQTSHLSYL